MSYLQAEQLRIQALLDADIPTVARYFAEDLHYVHSTGRVDNRKSLLELLSSGSTKYLELEHRLTPVFVSEHQVVAHGEMQMLIEKAGQQRSISAITTTVWVLTAGQWKLSGFHSSSR